MSLSNTYASISELRNDTVIVNAFSSVGSPVVLLLTGIRIRAYLGRLVFVLLVIILFYNFCILVLSPSVIFNLKSALISY